MFNLRSSLGRKPAQRTMLVRNLVTSLILYEKIRTTKARAKAIQPLVDRLVSKAKKQPKNIAVRSLNTIVTDPNASKKIFEVLIDRYKSRPSGLTRIVPVGLRKGDGAQLVEISLVEDGDSKNTASTSKKKK